MTTSAQLSAPAKQAARLIRELKISTGPIPVEKVAKHLKALVRYSSFDDEISGMVFVKEGVPVIGVNALHHPNRQRFTIAHEIGHLVLHREHVTSHVHVDKQYRVLMRNSRSSRGTDLIEIEANQFAAELLMPYGMLQDSLGDFIDLDDEESIETLARKFKVSKQAMSHRLSGFLSMADLLA
jgi:Zn-dependent peptidase ImmA (M78 family)